MNNIEYKKIKSFHHNISIIQIFWVAFVVNIYNYYYDKNYIIISISLIIFILFNLVFFIWRINHLKNILRKEDLILINIKIDNTNELKKLTYSSVFAGSMSGLLGFLLSNLYCSLIDNIILRLIKFH